VQGLPYAAAGDAAEHLMLLPVMQQST